LLDTLHVVHTCRTTAALSITPSVRKLG